MAKYCITAANHSNKDSHCASKFKVYEYSTFTETWKNLGGQSISFIGDLLAKGHTVVSGHYNKAKNTISTGAPIELELRIAKNGTDYKISDMPTF
jgi:hypothetical protein